MAANAYANMAKMGASMPAEDNSAMRPSFGEVLKTSIQESMNTMKTGEQMSAKAVTGEASLPDVVSAVNAAELTLSTVVAVRDRMINAYQEIMRMPI
ncbi:MAG: flagellar hook-basal body complex protein FliE [Micavibrio aeruginosavorus]|uniref:Flagellar hook-basal body complex protein FliE n=1 Tax=Micavibrio aeruginosavorus TaxID=349221 RepID=A0A2W5N4Y4_9BACT|nr:MAG: flagellar hook-basal body complex protein FliE [Micavibrio aeruginosavorus]